MAEEPVLIDDSELYIPYFSKICTFCKHWDVAPGRKCKAFPAGIPMEIWMGEVGHSAPYPGDNGVLFEALDA
jgi:hypothetical protein